MPNVIDFMIIISLMHLAYYIVKGVLPIFSKTSFIDGFNFHIIDKILDFTYLLYVKA